MARRCLVGALNSANCIEIHIFSWARETTTPLFRITSILWAPRHSQRGYQLELHRFGFSSFALRSSVRFIVFPTYISACFCRSPWALRKIHVVCTIGLRGIRLFVVVRACFRGLWGLLRGIYQLLFRVATFSATSRHKSVSVAFVHITSYRTVINL